MFAQANSEHCRHKIFNADWIVDGVPQPQVAVLDDPPHARRQSAGNHRRVRGQCGDHGGWRTRAASIPMASAGTVRMTSTTHILMKVETHNHPTAIAPFPGAATGSGGEIRDEGATGIGAKPKAGLTGFTMSHLRIPGMTQPWELPDAHAGKSGSAADEVWIGKPERIASALSIMLDGPIGGASFNNEFGRPDAARLLSHLRAERRRRSARLPQADHDRRRRRQRARARRAQACAAPRRAVIVQLGGPGMLIGVGGGAASSMSDRRRTPPISISTRCSAATRRCSAARRR